MKNRSHVYLLLLSILTLTACGGSGADEQSGAQPTRPGAQAPARPTDAADRVASALPNGAPPTDAGAAAPAAPSTRGAESAATAADGRSSAQPAAPAGTPAMAPAASEPDAAAILKRAESVYEGVRTMEADFTQEVTVPLLDQTQRSAGRIYHRRPDRFAMRFSNPQGDLIVADGRSLWMYYPSTDAKQVIRSDLAQSGQQVDLQREFLSDATARFNVVLTGSESVAGRPAQLLVLTPRGQSPYRRVRLWVDQQDHLVRRFEILEQNESLRRLELRNIRTNSALSDDLFRFTPPPGTQVFEH